MTAKRTSLTAMFIEESSPLSQILSDASETFTLSWEDKAASHPARYGLYVSERSLTAIYACPIAAWTARHDNRGDFVSGLWEYDVAELFIYSTENKHYQEFNLAPSGAWWSAVFSGYRALSTAPLSPPAVETLCVSSEAGWNAAIRIPFSELKIPFSLEGTRINLCLIQGEAPRRYLSAATIETSDPDFHATQCYLPLKPPSERARLPT